MRTVGNSVIPNELRNKLYHITGAMFVFGALILCGALALTVFAVDANAAEARKKSADNVTVSSYTATAPQQIIANQINPRVTPSLRLAAPGDRCIGDLSIPSVGCALTGWVIGQEVYKAYQDPEINCPGAYPFTVDTVHFLLGFNPVDTNVVFPLVIPISVDIEALDTTTNPGCRLPGAVLFSGAPGSVSIPQLLPSTGPTFFDIAVPLDVPFVVNGPYLVGFRFNDSIPPEWRVAIATDETEVLCATYNLWDTTLGFVDLGDDTLIHHETNDSLAPCFNAPPDPGPCPNGKPCFDFDGRLLLWSNGVTGGTPPTPAPGIAILGPLANDKLYGSTDIWVNETSGSSIIDSAVFYQRTASTAWTRIGVDVDQNLALAQTAVFGPGQGLSYLWDFSAETEETHWIKVEIFDSLLQKAVDSVSVFLEPTPPVPSLNSPSYFGRFCDTITLTYDIVDENPASGVLLKKQADARFSQSLGTQYQFALGDVDGDTADGNPASQGEFGDFFGGPSVGALALRYWHGKGFSQSLRVGGSTLTNAQAAERLAIFTNVRVNGSLSDEEFVLGFRQYLLVTGFGELIVEFKRQVTYSVLRNWTEEVGVCGLIRIAGSSGGAGFWFAVDGFDGLPNSVNSFKVRVSDPQDGTIKSLFWRDGFDAGELFYQGAWHKVEIVVGVKPKNWVIPGRSGIGFDFVSGSQWSVVVDSSSDGLTDGGLYFITAQVTDQNSNLGEHTTLLELNCASFAIGDYDGNGVSNVADLVYLVSFQILGGPAPVGGAVRADANCDSTIDQADLIFYINWVFAGGAPPCH